MHFTESLYKKLGYIHNFKKTCYYCSIILIFWWRWGIVFVGKMCKHASAVWNETLYPMKDNKTIFPEYIKSKPRFVIQNYKLILHSFENYSKSTTGQKLSSLFNSCFTRTISCPVHGWDWRTCSLISGVDDFQTTQWSHLTHVHFPIESSGCALFKRIRHINYVGHLLM